jgi:MFS family permease
MPKAVLEWFPLAEVGRAVGIYTSAAAIGVIAVFSAAPFFESEWRSLFLASGGLAVAIFGLWIVLGRSHTSAGGSHAAPAGGLTRQLLELLKERDVQVLSLICAAAQVGIFGWLAFGFPFLVIARGATQQAAGAVVSVTMLGFLVGALSISLVSDRLGRRRPFFTGGGVISALLLLLLPYLPLGPLMWLAVFVLGLCFATLQVLLFALPLELPSVGSHRVGACEGVVISLGFFAGIAASPLLGRLIGDFSAARAASFQVVLAVIAAILLLAALVSLLLPETGSARTRRASVSPR